MKLRLTVLFVALGLLAFAQKPLEATLTFNISYIDAPLNAVFTKKVFPTGFVLKIKGPNTRLGNVGGLMPALYGEQVYRADSQQHFFVNDTTKTVTFLHESQRILPMPTADYEVKPGSNKRNILGFECDHYIVKSNVDATLLTEFWVAPELQAQVAVTASSGLLLQSSLFGLKGLALRAVMGNIEQTMLIEASSINYDSLPDSIFAAPKHYTVRESKSTEIDLGGSHDR